MMSIALKHTLSYFSAMAAYLKINEEGFYVFTHIFLHTQSQLIYNFTYFHSEKGGMYFYVSKPVDQSKPVGFLF